MNVLARNRKALSIRYFEPITEGSIDLDLSHCRPRTPISYWFLLTLYFHVRVILETTLALVVDTSLIYCKVKLSLIVKQSLQRFIKFIEFFITKYCKACNFCTSCDGENVCITFTERYSQVRLLLVRWESNKTSLKSGESFIFALCI